MLEPNQEPKAARREPNPLSQSTRSTELEPLEGSLPSSELSEAEIQIEQYRQWKVVPVTTFLLMSQP